MTLPFSFMTPLASIWLCKQETTEILIVIHPYATHVFFLSPSISVLNQVSETKSGPVVLFKVNS